MNNIVFYGITVYKMRFRLTVETVVKRTYDVKQKYSFAPILKTGSSG